MATHDAEGRKLNRREFFQWAVWAAGGIFGLIVAIPLVGYILAPFFRTPPEEWVRVCSLDEINSLTPTEFRIAFKREDAPQSYEDVRGVFVIRKGREILAFTNVCTHMGCSTRWLDWRQQILCPCHGGLYDRWGQLMGGPPAHSLPFYVSKIEGNDLYVANRYVFRV
ncbi:MAG: ubiquinol-cytochrome c reductase iron-sulfur subunit [Dehalococcoidales bacterium]|nr:ubiquinol-cytochrome c reductase iron-sulfur subunit [Dehalococcoidales bacterium]